MNHEQFQRAVTAGINRQAKLWADHQSRGSDNDPPNRRVSAGRRVCRGAALKRVARHVPGAEEPPQGSGLSAAQFQQGLQAAVRRAAEQNLAAAPGERDDNRSLRKAEAFRQARRRVLRLVENR